MSSKRGRRSIEHPHDVDEDHNLKRLPKFSAEDIVDESTVTFVAEERLSLPSAVKRSSRISPVNTLSQQELAEQISWEDSPSMLSKQGPELDDLKVKTYSSLAIPRVEGSDDRYGEQDNTLDDLLKSCWSQPVMNSMTSQDRYPSNSNGKYVANLDNQFSIFDQASVSMEPVVTSISESEANNLQAFISNVKFHEISKPMAQISAPDNPIGHSSHSPTPINVMHYEQSQNQYSSKITSASPKNIVSSTLPTNLSKIYSQRAGIAGTQIVDKSRNISISKPFNSTTSSIKSSISLEMGPPSVSHTQSLSLSQLQLSAANKNNLSQQPAPAANVEVSVVSAEEMAFLEELERQEMQRLQPVSTIDDSLQSKSQATMTVSQVEFISDEEMAHLEAIERLEMMTAKGSNIQTDDTLGGKALAAAKPSAAITTATTSINGSYTANNIKLQQASVLTSSTFKCNNANQMDRAIPPSYRSDYSSKDHVNSQIRSVNPANPYQTIGHVLTSITPPVGKLPRGDVAKSSSQPVGQSVSPSTKQTTYNNQKIRCRRFTAIYVENISELRKKEIHCVEGDANDLETIQSLQECLVILTGRWFEMDPQTGDKFHILQMCSNIFSQSITVLDKNWDVDHAIILDDNNGLFISHPDILVSPTRIAESCSCIRRSVLSDRVRSFGGYSYAATLGNLKHMFLETLMDQTLKRCSLSTSLSESQPLISVLLNEREIHDIITRCIDAYHSELDAVNCSDDQARDELMTISPTVIEWILTSYQSSLFSYDEIRQYPKKPGKSISLRSIESVEDNIWCPALGMKGQIDIVAKCMIRSKEVLGNKVFSRQCIIPLEIKTGKWRPSTVVSHRAQVILYILMILLTDQVMPFEKSTMDPAVPFTEGVLVYFPSKEDISAGGDDGRIRVEYVAPTWFEIQALVIARNQLAFYLKASDSIIKPTPLPPLLKSRDCEFCYQASECMIYHKAIEDGSAESSGVPDLFSFVTNHLTQSNIEYFRHWDHLINLESSIVTDRTSAKKLWLVDGSDRILTEDSSLDEFMLTMILSESHASELDTSITKPGEGPYLLVLRRNHNAVRSEDLGRFSVGDRVHISVVATRTHSSQPNAMDMEDLIANNTFEKDRGKSKSKYFAENVIPNVTIGNVMSYSKDLNEINVSIASYPSTRVLKCLQSSRQKSSKYFIRIEKDDGSLGLSTLRSNLISLLIAPFNGSNFKEYKSELSHVNDSQSLQRLYGKYSPDSNNRIKGLIVDLIPPKFLQSFPKVPTMYDLFCPQDVNKSDFFAALKQYNQFHGNIYPVLSDFDSYSKASSRVPYSFINDDTMCLGKVTIYSGCNPFQLYEEYLSLNTGQQQAFHKVLNADDYALILGLPGSGKTQTLSLITRALIARNKRVLISSYTHSAIDNLLIKLCEANLPPFLCLRLGSLSSIHPSAHQYALDIGSMDIESENDSNKGLGIDDLGHRGIPEHTQPHRSLGTIGKMRLRIDNSRLIACTVLAASTHPVLADYNVDWTIVDEAGQISEPAVIGALLKTKSFVLVGDSHQLPPLVVSKEAQKLGMDVSLFQRLSDRYPNSVSALTTQYRMNEDIMALCNHAIYETKMTCGNVMIANQKLVLPKYAVLLRQLEEKVTDTVWIKISIAADPSIIFLNTDGIYQNKSSGIIDKDNVKRLLDGQIQNLSDVSTQALAIAADSSIQLPDVQGPDHASLTQNSIERIIVSILVWALSVSGCDLNQLAIISPYKKQVNLLRDSLRTCRWLDDASAVEISTIDKFQGRDMDVVIFSSVVNMQSNSIGELLKDWRRINVAITRYFKIFDSSYDYLKNIHVCRAKKKLILVGSATKWRSDSTLSKILDFVMERRWLTDLSSKSLDLYSNLQDTRQTE